jgi:hypothetical protein
MPRRDLDRLTRRWRERHDARRVADPERPPAEPAREARARRGFPYRSLTPADYVAQHGDEMPGFTYDDESYSDAKLDAWIVEVGRLLRERREEDASAPPPPSAPEEATRKEATRKEATPKPPRKRSPKADG